MDLFKKLPFDLQERIYEDFIFKKRYDEFVKIFDNLVDCVSYLHYRPLIDSDYIKIEEAEKRYRNDIISESIEIFVSDVNYVKRDY
jgi:hypothetical protein